MQEYSESTSNCSPEPLRRIGRALLHLEPDAVEVVALVAERLVLGRKQYGDLNIREDTRDFAVEATQEALDWLVYRAILQLREHRDTRPMPRSYTPVMMPAVRPPAMQPDALDLDPERGRG